MVEFFDRFGRAIPTGVKAPVHDAIRRRFVCRQPELDYGAILGRLKTHLAPDLTLTPADFKARAEAILAGLAADPATASVANGPHIPFVLPRDAGTDIGERLETHYIGAVARAFSASYPDYSVANHHKESLKGQLSVAPGSRHDRLLAAVAADSVVGIYFPALLEYSIPAAIELVQSLPERFLLAGGYDTCAALVAAPGLLFDAENYPPLLWLAGLADPTPTLGYHFEAYGFNLTFNQRPHLGNVSEYWAAGLTVLG